MVSNYALDAWRSFFARIAKIVKRTIIQSTFTAVDDNFIPCGYVKKTQSKLQDYISDHDLM